MTDTDVNYSSYEEMNNDPMVKEYTSTVKMRKIRIAYFHRKVGDPNATDFGQLMPPAGAVIDIVDYTPMLHPLTIAGNRNKAIEWAIRDGMDYVFFVDDDVIIPKDALILLLSHNAEITAGVCYRKRFPLETVGMNLNKEGFVASMDDYTIGDIIHETFVVPAGCSLVRIDAIKRIDPPWYKTIMCQGVVSFTEDAYFGWLYRKAQIDAVTDTRVQCLHLDARGVLYGHPDVIDVETNRFTPKYKDAFAFNGTWKEKT